MPWHTRGLVLIALLTLGGAAVLGAAAPAVTLTVSATGVTVGAPAAVRWAVDVSGVTDCDGRVALVRPALAVPAGEEPPSADDPPCDRSFFPLLDPAGHTEQGTREPGNRLPLTPGTYTFRARVITAAGEALDSAPVTVTVRAADAADDDGLLMLLETEPLSAVALTATPASPQTMLTPVGLTATPAGGTVVEFLFQAKRGQESTWTTLQDYNTDDTVEWTPAAGDYYRLRVTAREQGTAAPTYTSELGYYNGATALTALALAVSPPSPQTGTLPPDPAYTLTAIPTGGAHLQYQFWVRRAGEASFTQLRDYAAGPTCTWAPTQDGYYNLRVFCREEGSPGGYDKQTTIRDYVNATPLTALALSANPASPMLTVPPDDPITLTAAPTGGLNLEYRFYVKRGRDASYTLVQDYSAADTYAWTPTVADCYLLMAYAREVGSALTYDATTATAYYVGYQPLTGVALSAQESSPQPLQTPIHLTATPTGGANLEYEFAVKRGADSAWTILRAYGAGTTLTWTPAEATYYRLRVSAREVGRTGGIQTASLDYYIGTTPLTAVATSADPASPQAPQTPITLTAAPTGGVAPEYRFWIKRGQEADWTDARDYATTATHVWTPMVADFYLIRVWARETGNPASYQVIAPRVPYYIGTTPLSAVALAANPSSPQPVHGPITLTATPTGGAVPEYKFQVKRAGAPTWVTLQDYSPTATCPWTPTVPDTYTLRVHGREIGNDLVSYSVAATVTYVIGTPPTVSLTAPPHEAVYHAPTSVTLTADAADDGAVARVEFYQGATKLGEDTTAPYSYTWDAVPAGTYSLTAVAIDDIGLATTSTPVEITVNTRPTIVLTAPAPGESFSAPASIEAIATAEDEDGTVTQVDFYHGTTLLATDTAAPFIVSLPQVDEGVYTLHAVATDDRGGTAESAPITYHIRPLNAPVVLLTAPEAGHVFAPGTDITVTANAYDRLGTVTKVEFYHGATKLGEDTETPYSCLWTAVPMGAYLLTAVARNDAEQTSVSAAVAIIVDTAPTAAADAAVTDEDVAVTVSVLANDAGLNGQALTVTACTAGSHGTTQVNPNNTVTYTPNPDWSGTDSFTYTVRDELGLESIGQVTITVTAVTDVPRVTLATPADGARLERPAAIQLGATVDCPDGTVTKVEFYQGSTKLGEDTTAPYSYTWRDVALGEYTLTAVVIGSTGQATSNAVTITVGESLPAPLITLNAPKTGSVLAAHSAITLTAIPDTTIGIVQKVEFFANNVKVGEDTNGTDGWSVAWTGGAAGFYELTSAVTYLEEERLLGESSFAKLLFPNQQLFTANETTGSQTSPSTSVQLQDQINCLPTVTITQPTDGASIATNMSVIISGTVTDDDGVVTAVAIQDTVGGRTTEYAAALAKNGQTWVKELTFTTPGTHTLTVRATDNTSGIGTSSPLTLYVANPAPSVRIVSPGVKQADGSYWTAMNRPTKVPLVAEAYDTNGSIDAVTFYVERVATGARIAAVPGHLVEHSHHWTGEWNCSALVTGPFGDYRIYAVAEDNESTSVQSQTVTVLYSSLPALNIQAIEPWVHGSGTMTLYEWLEMGTTYQITANAFDVITPNPELKLYVDYTLAGPLTGTYQVPWSGTLRGIPYSFSVRGTGSGGETLGAEFALSLTNPAPVGYITQPVGTGAYPPGQLALKGYFYDVNNPVTTVTACLYDDFNGNLLQQQPLTTDGTPFGWTGAMTINDPGTYYLEFYTQDPHGDIGAPATYLTITADATPPAPGTPPQGPHVTVLSPTHDPQVNPHKAFLINPNTIVFTGRAFDLTRPLTTMTFTVNGPGGTTWTKSLQCGAGINTKTVVFPDATWTPAPPTYLPLGDYTVTVHATNDQAVSGQASAPFEVKNLNPMIEITAPGADAEITTPAVVKIGLTASEYNGFLTEVEFTVRNASGQVVWNRPHWTGSSITGRHGSYTATRSFSPGDDLLTKALAPGTYTITATATDNEGGTATATRIFTVVNPKPAVTITYPANNMNFPQSPLMLVAHAIATDINGLAAPTVTFVLRKGGSGDAIFKSVTDVQAPYVGTIPNLPPGSYTLVAEAEDDDGSVTVSPTIPFTVGPVPPPQRKSEPTDGDPVNLLRGEEQYSAPDLAVYNPKGIHVAFTRFYSTALAKRWQPAPLAKDEEDDPLLIAGLTMTGSTGQPEYAPVAHTIAEPGWLTQIFVLNGEPAFSKARSCSGGLTPGWTHNYDVSYVIDPDTGDVVVRFPNGGEERLTPPAGGDGTVSLTPAAGAAFSAKGQRVGGDFSSITFTWADGTQWVLTAAECRHLATIRNAVGQSIKLDWAQLPDGLPGLQSISDSADDPLLTLTYAGSTLASITDERQERTVAYTYGDVSRPWLETASHFNSTDPALEYTYHPSSDIPLLTSVSAPSPVDGALQVETRLTYSDGGTAASTADWKITGQTNVSGTWRQYLYRDGETEVRVFDSGDNLLTRWVKHFDAEGRETGTTDAAGASSATTYGDARFPNKPTAFTAKDGKTVSMAYDALGNIQSVTTPLGTTVTVYTYSAPGTNAPLGRLLQAQHGAKPPMVFTYDPDGLLHTATAPAPGTLEGQQTYDTVTTTYTYDNLGNILTITGPGNDPNDPDATVTVSYDYTDDTFAADPVIGQTARAGQPLKVSQIVSGVERATHFRYNFQGQLTPYLQRVYDGEGHRTSYAYNIAGQVTDVVLPATGQTGPGQSRLATEYRYPGGPVTSSTLYDEQAPPQAVRSVAYQYDSAGHIVTRTGNVEQSSTQYDALGRMTALVHPNNIPTVYYYDGLGRLATTVYPDGREVRFTSYDAAGRLLQRVVENGAADIVTELTYHGATGLLASLSVPNGTAPDVSFTYNTDGTLASTATAGVGTKSFTYDALGHVLTATTTYDGVAPLTLSYDYYRNGLRSAMQTPATATPNAGLFRYFYNEAGQATQQVDALDLSAAWAYRLNGWLQTQTLSNGQTPVAATAYTQNAAGQLTALLNTGPGLTVLSSFTGLGYDGAGNRISLTASFPDQPTRFSGETAYTYDALDQLFQEVSARDGGYGHDFVYDPAGNLLQHRTGSNPRLYDEMNRWIGELVDHVPDYSGFQYDALGNPNTYRGVSLVFDEANSLRQYGAVFSAGYTGDGLRAWTGPAGATLTERTYFLYDGLEPVCEVQVDAQTGQPFVTALNCFGAGGLYARAVYNAGTESYVPRLYTFDPQGSVAQRLDAQGTVLASDLYDAWGRLLACRDANDDPFPLADDPWGYKAEHGYYTDRETALLLCTFRYYDPEAGRFLTEDPIGYLGGLNVYRYCENDPVQLADPLGWCPEYSGDVGDDFPMSPKDLHRDFFQAIHKGAGTTRKGMEFYLNVLNPVENARQAATGRDLWNNEMSAGDRTIAAIGCMPIGGVAKAGKAAAKVGDVIDVASKASKNDNAIKCFAKGICFVAETPVVVSDSASRSQVKLLMKTSWAHCPVFAHLLSSKCALLFLMGVLLFLLSAMMQTLSGTSAAMVMCTSNWRTRGWWGLLILAGVLFGGAGALRLPLAVGANVVARENAHGGTEVLTRLPAVPAHIDLEQYPFPTSPIETITQGQQVVTRNPVTGTTETNTVVRTFQRTAYEIIQLDLADKTTGKAVESLRGTPEHPFFTPNGMVEMGQLTPGMEVCTRNTDKRLIIKAVTREQHPEGIPVYNFEVEDDHTYFVGQAGGGAWVHNRCYPIIIDPRTRKPISFPDGQLIRIPKDQRVNWGSIERAEYIAEWYRRGYQTPAGGWSKYHIHHIKPREFGGGNDFDNLVPVLSEQHPELNSFWRDFPYEVSP